MQKRKTHQVTGVARILEQQCFGIVRLIAIRVDAGVGLGRKNRTGSNTNL